MLYAILAYHVEDEVASWSPEQDAALMLDLNRVHGRLEQDKRLGPAARLGATKGACVLRGKGKGVVTDGPFTETKEHSTSTTAPTATPRSRPRATCARSILPRCMKSARLRSIAPAFRSRRPSSRSPKMKRGSRIRRLMIRDAGRCRAPTTREEMRFSAPDATSAA
jgi:hypothetical protein